jgi:preprotein translocase subunit YajC
MFLIFIPLILLLFWQSRSQQKKQEQAIAGLKKGDRVVTQSGLVGRLLELDTRYARLEIAPGVKVQVLRTSLAGRDAEDSAKTPESDKKTESDKKSGDADKDKADKAEAPGKKD